MRNIEVEYKKILNKLNNAKPNEVGAILKEYFNLKRKNNKK